MNDYIQRAMTLIKRFEGLELKAYKPTPDDVWTIGFGNTVEVSEGNTINLAEAYEHLIVNISIVDAFIDHHVKVKLYEGQRAAIISLIYNVGISSFKVSRALKHLNNDDMEEFKREAFSSELGWTKQKGKVLPGLVRRRAIEQMEFELG